MNPLTEWYIMVRDPGTFSKYWLHKSGAESSLSQLAREQLRRPYFWSFGWRGSYAFETKDRAFKCLGSTMPGGLEIPAWAEIICSDDLIIEEIILT